MKQTRPNSTFQTGEVSRTSGNLRVGALGGGSTPEEVMPNSTYLYSSSSYNPQKTLGWKRSGRSNRESLSTGGRYLSTYRSLWQGQAKPKHHSVCYGCGKSETSEFPETQPNVGMISPPKPEVPNYATHGQVNGLWCLMRVDLEADI